MLLLAGELLVAAPGILKQVPDFQGETIALRDDLQEIVLAIKNNRDKNIVVLSLGDPLFFGTTRYLCDEIGKNEFEIIPMSA